MGLIGSMIAGAAETAGATGAKIGLDSMQADIQALRDQRLQDYAKELANIQSQQRQQEYVARSPVDIATHKANAEEDATQAIRKAKESPRTIPAGATEKIGADTYLAPFSPTEEQLKQADVALKKAQADYWEGAKTNEANARAAAAANGKAVMPKIVKVSGENGDYLVDENSGAVGVIVPGSPAKDAVWHAFSKNEPATPEVLQHTKWATADGRPLPNGPFELYRQLPVNGAGGAPQVTGTTNALGSNVPGYKVYPQDIEAAKADPEARQKLASIVGGNNILDGIISDYDKTKVQPSTTQNQARPRLVGDRAQAGPTPAEIAVDPRLAQTSPAERAQSALAAEQARKDARAALDARIPTARTPQQKMQLFRDFSAVMTPEERRMYASGRG